MLGTVGYMSPEQASGREVDFRTDQFALGTILYEMVTGKRPFQRATGAETLAAIIRDEPEDAARLNPKAPAPLRWIIDRCLEKDPEDRFASTTDLARDLASLREHLSESTSAAEGLTRGARAPPLAAARGLARARARGGRSARRARAARREGGHGARPALPAADVPARRGAHRPLRSRRAVGRLRRGLGGRPARGLLGALRRAGVALAGAARRRTCCRSRTNGEMAISLGRHYVFGWESRGTLARVPLGGGAPREVLEGVETADWAPDGGSLAVARDGGARRRLEFPVGKVLYETAGWISGVRVSPDGRRVAFWNHPSRGDNLASLDVIEADGTRRSLGRAGRARPGSPGRRTARGCGPAASP